MPYCKMYDKKEDVDCNKCSKENNFPEWYCCLNECGQHEFCGGCKNKSIIDVGYSEPVLLGNVEALKKLGIYIKI